MRIVFIRTNAVNPDPRVEKEVNSLLKNPINKITIIAWDRENIVDTESFISLDNGSARIIRFGIKSEWGGGMRKNLIPLIRFAKKVNHWLKKHVTEFDCLHCCDLPTAIMCGKLLKKKRFVYDIFDYFPDTAHAPKSVLLYAKKQENKMISRADCTIICSEQRRQQIGKACPKKLVVIHNSPNVDLLDKVSEKSIIKSKNTNKIRVVYVGNLIEERFIHKLISVAIRHEEIELHIGGIGPLQNLAKESSETCRNIFYYGRLQYCDVLTLEKECDVLSALYDPSIPNNRFAAPNKFYEALLVGKPLIMLKNTGVDSFVSNYSLGSVALNASEEDIYLAILSAFEIGKSDGFSLKAKKIYKEKFSWEIMENRLLSIYEELNKN